MSHISLTVTDNNFEKSAFSVSIIDLNAISYTATLLEVDALVAALQDITLGAVSQKTVVAESVVLTTERPIDPHANREAGVVFGMVSAVSNSKVRATVPAPALALFPFAALGIGRINAPFTGLSIEVQAFVDQLEDTAVYVAPDGTVEGITVAYMEHVGRNL